MIETVNERLQRESLEREKQAAREQQQFNRKMERVCIATAIAAFLLTGFLPK